MFGYALVGVRGLGLVRHCIWEIKDLRIVGAFVKEWPFSIMELDMALEVVVGRRILDMVFLGKIREVEQGFPGMEHSLRAGPPSLTLPLFFLYSPWLLRIKRSSGRCYHF